MEIAALGALRGYADARPVTAPDPDSGPGAVFGDAMRNMTATVAKGEATAKAAMLGEADPHSLVSALAQTELAVETAATIRDKVVEAYQEILRMPV
ncbi:flagellar hook-basal body complex protein FliE [Roseicyclus sp. F158]|uniref:Flagellar hook-basal body complex protein FliE n=1 Tax=Tropicimonas omnivorans TaxID=3075590 RepID=A0ABU3DDB1_9RHOB|nr:flagellar hook-basal body complex protein FliE [Roseicyclus sp. F158]MDT0681691.1 flagellar hook-basal body complex protein FliE [Roseicyclus sp. F158]